MFVQWMGYGRQGWTQGDKVGWHWGHEGERWWWHCRYRPGMDWVYILKVEYKNLLIKWMCSAIQREKLWLSSNRENEVLRDVLLTARSAGEMGKVGDLLAKESFIWLHLLYLVAVLWRHILFITIPHELYDCSVSSGERWNISTPLAQ